MKTHKRQQNAVGLTPSLLQQQYQLHSQQHLHQQLQAQLKHLTPDPLPTSSAQSLELLLSRDHHHQRDVAMATPRDMDSRDVVMAAVEAVVTTTAPQQQENRTDSPATWRQVLNCFYFRVLTFKRLVGDQSLPGFLVFRVSTEMYGRAEAVDYLNMY